MANEDKLESDWRNLLSRTLQNGQSDLFLSCKVPSSSSYSRFCTTWSHCHSLNSLNRLRVHPVAVKKLKDENVLSIKDKSLRSLSPPNSLVADSEFAFTLHFELTLRKNVFPSSPVVALC